MMKPKILIQKNVVLDSLGHFRYYSVNNIGKRFKEKALVIDLNLTSINTEKQLCRFIYENWGSGRYRISAFAKGRQGTWCFWKGDIDEHGFSFDKRDNISNNREINQLKKELNAATEEYERDIIKEELQWTTELEKDINQYVKYGFVPYLTASARRGDFVLWTDEEEIKQVENPEKVW